MERVPDSGVITSSILSQIPFILHGFGTKYFQEKELSQLALSKNLIPVYLRQQHSDKIHILSERANSLLEGDAVITSLPGVMLIIKTADCLPVLMVDPEKRIIGAVHCGWRGTAARLLEKVVTHFAASFSSSPQSLRVAFGPSILKKCYEVGDEVRAIFGEDSYSLDEAIFQPHPYKKGFFFLDLRLANRKQLLNLGVQPEMIREIDICPHCHQDFFSWRRDKNRLTRLLNFICLNPLFD